MRILIIFVIWKKKGNPLQKIPGFKLPKCRYQCRIHVSTWPFIIASCFRQNEQNLQIMSILKAVSESGRVPRKLENKFEGIQSNCCWTLRKRDLGYPIVPIMLSEIDLKKTNYFGKNKTLYYYRCFTKIVIFWTFLAKIWNFL